MSNTIVADWLLAAEATDNVQKIPANEETGRFDQMWTGEEEIPGKANRIKNNIW